MNLKNITRVIRCLDQWEYDQILSMACKVTAVQLETKYAQDAYFMLGSSVRKNVNPPVETLAKCFPYINMGVVMNHNERDVMTYVIHSIRDLSPPLKG